MNDERIDNESVLDRVERANSETDETLSNIHDCDSLSGVEADDNR